jgi:hypothetical protein
MASGFVIVVFGFKTPPFVRLYVSMLHHSAYLGFGLGIEDGV